MAYRPIFGQRLVHIFLVATMWLAPRAEAAPAIDLQLYRPVTDAGGILNAGVGESGSVGGLRLGLWSMGARQLMRTEISEQGVNLGDIVTDRYDVALALGYTPIRRLELGAVIPFTVYQTGLQTELMQRLVGKTELRQQSLNDILLRAKYNFLREKGYPGLAFGLEGTVPTGSPEEFTGEPGVAVAAMLSTSKRFSKTHLTVDLGFRYRTEPMELITLKVRNEWVYRLALAHELASVNAPKVWSVLFGLSGQTSANQPFNLLRENRRPLTGLEAMLGVRRRADVGDGGLAVTFGMGGGILPGYGVPLVRALLGLEFWSSEPARDSDRDGVPNRDDLCPSDAEDMDDFADLDGCPEPDNDQDGVDDIDDECPDEAEDRDGYEDNDGCPELTDVDTDSDGVDDSRDKCNDQREDIDGFQDDDGCLDEDNDGDTLKDINDLCPNDFEDMRRSKDQDGCPGGGKKPLARLVNREILLAAEVEFAEGSSNIVWTSNDLLDAVAALLRRDKDIRRLEIRVQPNKDPASIGLGGERARAVMDYLTSKGIEGTRLVTRAVDQPEAKQPTVRFLVRTK